MAETNSNEARNPRTIADAFKGGQEGREDLRTGQSRINRSPETQAALDSLIEEGGN